MKKFSILLLSIILFASSITVFSQQLRFNDLLLQKEENPSIYFAAKREAVRQNLPVSIYIPGEVLAEVITTADGILYYCVINNFADPYDGGKILSSTEVLRTLDLDKARLIYGDGRTINNSEETVTETGFSSSTRILLIPDWTNDNVMAFDPQTGDLVNANFVNPDPTNLASPKHAILNPAGFISVSDQITDLVQKYDTGGVYMQIFAPAGGVNNAILDNLRGHGYHPGNRDLLVTTASGTNANAIARFDAGGNFVNNFVSPGSGVTSPFGILGRTNDVLISWSANDVVRKYNLDGTLIGDFASGINYPQQVCSFPAGNIAVALFSTPGSGLVILDSTGIQVAFLGVVTGLRGGYALGSGTILVTNGAGVHEIDRTTGALIRTVHASTNCQYIELADYSVIPVELTSFTANVNDRKIILNWSTATEINNRGFEVQRSYDKSNFENIAFVAGAGTSAEKHNYSYSDQPDFNGMVYYRLKQVDYDGSFEYSNIIETDLSILLEFSVKQNFPNPFNPVTNIKFSIPTDELVKVEIFNAIGETVRTIEQGMLKAGNHSISFSAAGLNSGVYYYKISAGNYSDVRKMILMK